MSRSYFNLDPSLACRQSAQGAGEILFRYANKENNTK